ncbi:uncharacterized protein LOC110859062 [Folsomia candida]|uniref:uncharacterized protein LOC110859062 n=1 Tax=Folsomia candida TaxID=158441 RepID=UPI000B9014D7|nr:uncharacterized protein LOC110859062 [Folsomia candida]
MAKDMSTFERMRGGHKGCLTKIQATIAKHENSSKLLSVDEAKGLLKSVETLESKARDIADDIFSLCTTDDLMKKAVEEADDLDMRIIETLGRLQVILRSYPDTSGSAAIHKDTVKLPRMELPDLDGKYENWQSFQDLFIASIDNNKALSGAQKLQYFKVCVKGDAFNLIKSFSITDSHFREAWSLLVDRYDNKREITQALVNRIFSQPHLKQESASSLQQLLDVTMESMRSLRVLGRPVDEWDDLIVFIVTDRMDSATRREWAMSLTGTDPPSLKELQEFLEKHIRGLQSQGGKSSSSSSGERRQSSSQSHHGSGERRHSSSHSHHVSATAANGISCHNCKQSHYLYQCQPFRTLSPEERSVKVSNWSLCRNCFKSNHIAKDCPSNHSRKKCNKRHNTLLHFESRRAATPQSESSSSHINTQGSHDQLTLMKTALVNVEDKAGNQFTCRAFLDDGSESSFITESCATSLGLTRQRTNVKITGLSSSCVGSSKFKVNLNLSSLSQGSSFSVDALIVPRVTAPMPKLPINISSFSYLRGLKLADPKFNEPRQVDILLGADVVASIIRPGLKNGPKNTPIAQNTLLGWVLSGRTLVKSTDSAEVTVLHNSLEEVIQRFWEVEELPSQRHFTQEEKECEQHFVANHKRDIITGQYTVKLPFNNNLTNLGLSREQALRRLMSLERRFQKFPGYKDEYVKFMRDYSSLGHMMQIPPDKINHNRGFYLPHHFVLKENSSTTKLRVVFDGSARSTTGISLNAALMVGPTIQDDLCTILMRFRMKPIALKADIAKMYRQFKVAEEDWDFQKILWRESPSEPIKEYWLLTVTYGTAPAPYLATRSLQQLASDEASSYPIASKILLEDMYVDDLLGGASNVEQAIIVQKQLVDLVAKGGMQIRKWMTNNPTVLQSIPPELRESSDTLDLDSTASFPTLGIEWKPSSDVFTFSVQPSQHIVKITKRQLLSELAKVFDPLGFLSPVTINAKVMFQQLWKDNVSWDDELCPQIQATWLQYQQDLASIKQLQIPRCVTTGTVGVTHQIHGFSDASEKAYSAVVYLRTEGEDGNVTVRFIAAKTRVAPVKQLSIPRLELCGAVILSELIQGIMQACNLSCSVTAWTDSTLVLGWLKAFPGKWKRFVANRVAKIQEETPYNLWRYVRSEDNPADCASRGISTPDLINHHLWWTGPHWLQSSSFPSPHPAEFSAEVDREEKSIKTTTLHSTISDSIITRYSSLSRLVKITGYINRFIYNMRRKNKHERKCGPFYPQELEDALSSLVKIVQNQEFYNEVKCLERRHALPTKSKLIQLHPFLDQGGILRGGGRLQHSHVHEEQKHPIILPHNHHLTTIVIRQCHHDTLHGGHKLVLSTLLKKFWILRGRETIRHIIRKCVICRRHKANLAQQLMGSLPSTRVTVGRPFLNSGVDFAGPYQILKCKGKGARSFKCYFAIFVCFSTKAVHLEYVTDLTTEAFIACYKRFTARRGIPAIMYSDCGTNFVGAEKELAASIQSAEYNHVVANKLSPLGTLWKFNPPAAPHQGGLWEAGVKSVKFHLRRVIGQSNITLEEFGTLLCCVEEILNSRPLCALSTSLDDLDALTPAHFLIGGPINSVPEPNLQEIKINRLSRWQRVQQISQHFWKRWQNEYLSTLQQRFKWTQKRANFKKDDLVLVHDEQLPPAKWKLGRIIDVHPGADSLVRVVTIRTKSGDYKRPIAKLSPLLPCSD